MATICEHCNVELQHIADGEWECPKCHEIYYIDMDQIIYKDDIST